MRRTIRSTRNRDTEPIGSRDITQITGIIKARAIISNLGRLLMMNTGVLVMKPEPLRMDGIDRLIGVTARILRINTMSVIKKGIRG